MTGWRTEQLYGEGYINAAEVMAHEIFELQNTDILDTLSETIFMNTSFGEKLLYLSQVLSCEVEDEEIEEMLDNAYDDESIGITYCKEILSEIKKITGKDIKYVLWLCDSIEDIKNEYDDEENPLTEFDEYKTSDIILSDIGSAGKLYGYEKDTDWEVDE